MLNRIRQGFYFILGRYDDRDNKLAKEILSSEEYKVFLSMKTYDKTHSLRVLRAVMEDDLLKNQKDYLKLALLHDCGKGKAGLLRRVKKVLIGDSILKRHPEMARELLRKINPSVGELAKKHHFYDVDREMNRFQEIDDIN